MILSSKKRFCPRRDGSVAYYLSEPVVADDAKGVGPYLMALSEALLAKQSQE